MNGPPHDSSGPPAGDSGDTDTMQHREVRELRFGASSSSLPVARDVIARSGVAAGFDPEAVELARLAVSEVVTNALVHGRPPYALRVEVDVRLRVTVFDGSEREPALEHVDTAAHRGRGLAILSKIADRWGWERRAGGGKGVWFEMRR